MADIRKKERTTALVVSAVLAGFRAIDTGTSTSPHIAYACVHTRMNARMTTPCGALLTQHPCPSLSEETLPVRTEPVGQSCHPCYSLRRSKRVWAYFLGTGRIWSERHCRSCMNSMASSALICSCKLSSHMSFVCITGAVVFA
jgi:hypothetical protein